MGNYPLKKFEYNSDGNLIYFGMANNEKKSTNEDGWMIKKFTYDSDGNLLQVTKFIGKWDDRAK